MSLLWGSKEAARSLQNYWKPYTGFLVVLHILDFKNIFLWLGFSHFFAMLYFFSFFLPTRRTSSGSACTRHVAWNLHYACAHRILEGAPACHMACSLKFGSPHRDLPTEEEKKQPTKLSKRKSRSWLLVKNSMRHNFTDTEWNHALSKGICLFNTK